MDLGRDPGQGNFFLLELVISWFVGRGFVTYNERIETPNACSVASSTGNRVSVIVPLAQ